MLHLMRKHAGSLMIKIILGAIVVVFVFWGIGSYRERSAGRVALVNGEPISVTEYREAYNDMIQRLRATFGDTLDEAMIEQLKVKQQTLDQLIDQRLLIQEAERLKLGVSNDELAGAIRGIAAFQANGVFDGRLYRRVLDLNRMTPEVFEALQKRLMLVQRLERFLTDGVKVSDLEVDAFLAWQNTAVDIRYALFEPGVYRDIPKKMQDLEAYFKANASAYQSEEKVKVRYVRFDPKRYESRVTVTEEDLKEHYDTNLDTFRIPKTVEARHILLKISTEDSPEAVEEKRKKLEGILQRVKKGEDFAALARTYSEDPGKESGGLIGPFQKEMVDPAFAEAAFSLKPGEVSNPVKSRFGWHILRVEKVNEAKTLSFAEAKEAIGKKISEERSKSLAYDAAEALYDAVIGGTDFQAAASHQKSDILATDFFTKKIPFAAPDPETFASVAFSLQPGEISDIHEMKGSYYLLQAVEKIPPKTPDLDAVLESVKADFEKQKQWEKAQADAEAFLAAVKSGKSFEEEARQQKVKTALTGFFKRNNPIPGIGYAPEIARAAFELGREQEAAPGALKGEKGFFVIVLEKKTVNTPADAPADREKVRGQVERQKQRLAFGTLVAQLRKKAEISLEEGFAAQ